MLGVILTWLGGLLGGPFATAAVDAYRAKLAAGNDANKIAADLAATLAQINEARDALAQQVVIAEQGRWWTAIVRPLIALPFGVFLWKVVIWDTVLKYGHTDPLTPEMYNVMSVVISAYFGSYAVESAAKIFRAKK